MFLNSVRSQRLQLANTEILFAMKVRRDSLRLKKLGQTETYVSKTNNYILYLHLILNSFQETYQSKLSICHVSKTPYGQTLTFRKKYIFSFIAEINAIHSC